MKIGIVGAGFIGRALARLAVAQGHEVMIANSRGAHTLTSAAVALHCRTGSAAEAARFGEVVVLAIPLGAVLDLDPAPFAGKIVVDANNYYPERDGPIAALDAREVSTSRLVAQRLPVARVVKAFNAILQDDIEKDARPAGTPGRRALPLAADDAEAARIVGQLVDAFGFDPVPAGSLDESWRFERAMPAYCVPLDAEELRAALAAAERGVEVPPGSWRARREAEHAAVVAGRAASATASGPKPRIGFDGRGRWDIVDTQFHLGPSHDAALSLAAMDALGIRSALVDELWHFDAQGVPQPAALLGGGAYRSLSPLGLTASLQHPARFAFIQRIELDDPRLDTRIPLLAETPGCRSLRINLFTEADRRRMAAGEWDAALALAAQHRLPVSVMSEDSGAVLGPVAARLPALAVIVDHCGWVRDEAQWRDVLELARLPNVYLKWSHAHRAFRRFARPEVARQQALPDAVRAFGAERVMWASDVSFDTSGASWAELLAFVLVHPDLCDDERAWVLGRTARRVYRWEPAAA